MNNSKSDETLARITITMIMIIAGIPLVLLLWWVVYAAVLYLSPAGVAAIFMFVCVAIFMRLEV